MRAYLIDALEQQITEVNCDMGPDGSKINAIYDLLKCRPSGIDAVYLRERSEVIYVDDEGLCKNPTHFFVVAGYPQPLATRGLMLGMDGPDTVAVRSSIESVRRMVTFERLRVAGFSMRESSDTFLGMPVVHVEQRVHFEKADDDE